MSIWLPSIEQVLMIHERLVKLTGGAAGVRDVRLIESAIAGRMLPSAAWKPIPACWPKLRRSAAA